MLRLVIFGWLDVIVNDLLSERWRILWVRSFRHLGFGMLAATYFIKAFADAPLAFERKGGWAQMLLYVMSGLVCAWYTAAASLKPAHALHAL